MASKGAPTHPPDCWRRGPSQATKPLPGDWWTLHCQPETPHPHPDWPTWDGWMEAFEKQEQRRLDGLRKPWKGTSLLYYGEQPQQLTLRDTSSGVYGAIGYLPTKRIDRPDYFGPEYEYWERLEYYEQWGHWPDGKSILFPQKIHHYRGKAGYLQGRWKTHNKLRWIAKVESGRLFFYIIHKDHRAENWFIHSGGYGLINIRCREEPEPEGICDYCDHDYGTSPATADFVPEILYEMLWDGFRWKIKRTPFNDCPLVIRKALLSPDRV